MKVTGGQEDPNLLGDVPDFKGGQRQKLEVKTTLSIMRQFCIQDIQKNQTPPLFA